MRALEGAGLTRRTRSTRSNHLALATTGAARAADPGGKPTYRSQTRLLDAFFWCPHGSPQKRPPEMTPKRVRIMSISGSGRGFRKRLGASKMQHRCKHCGFRAVMAIPVSKLLRAPTSYRSIGAGAADGGGGARVCIIHRGFVSPLGASGRASAASARTGLGFGGGCLGKLQGSKHALNTHREEQNHACTSLLVARESGS